MKLEILAHRGWWTAPDDRNAVASFHRAFAAGYGVETDVRDRAGELVISHDMPDGSAITLAAFLALHARYPSHPTLALNVKADGLSRDLARLLEEHGVKRYFVFDMSVPDTLAYLNGEMRVFTRRSEYETSSLLDERAEGIWLDAFEQPYVPAGRLTAVLKSGKTPALVSPELHGKPHQDAWHCWRDILTACPVWSSAYLCTDLPGEAEAFFGHHAGGSVA